MILQPKPSPWLFAFLKNYEKFRPTAYKPTSKDVWTIGYGHTAGVREGDTCTTGTAEAWLAQDVARLHALLCPLLTRLATHTQMDAMDSLVFNIGVGKRDGVKGDFADSTLLNKFNAGDFKGAAAEFPKWDHQGGIELDGLLRRRKDEAARFLA